MNYIFIWLNVLLICFLIFIAALQFFFFPLNIAYLVKERRYRKRKLSEKPWQPFVSIVIPAYNEARVMRNCINSIINCGYPNFEIVLVDDGSTDETREIGEELAEEYPDQVRLLHKTNGGKGSALNYGTAHARGEIVLYVDADGVFTDRTIPEMLLGFSKPNVAAVCGNDNPVNLNYIQTKFLALISHVGTGFVRRALHMLCCVPVISGNSGAFRKEALEKISIRTSDGPGGYGPLRTDTVGEDLELTWRLLRAGYDVTFNPKALVYAESPSTFDGLWKQRVRWARGLLQSVKLHQDALFTVRFKNFSFLYNYTVLANVLLSVLQIFTLLVTAIGVLVLSLQFWFDNGYFGVSFNLPSTFMTFSIALVALTFCWSAFLVIFSALMDGKPGDLRYFVLILLWPIYSVAMSLTVVRGLYLELVGAQSKWNKVDRTGVISTSSGAIAKPSSTSS